MGIPATDTGCTDMVFLCHAVHAWRRVPARADYNTLSRRSLVAVQPADLSGTIQERHAATAR